MKMPTKDLVSVERTIQSYAKKSIFNFVSFVFIQTLNVTQLDYYFLYIFYFIHFARYISSLERPN